MKRTLPTIVLFVLLAGRAGPAAAAPPPAAEELTDAHVRAGITAFIDALYERRDPRHHWDPVEWVPTRDGSKYQTDGYTALAVLALLTAGESYQDPRLRDAITALEKAEMVGTYSVAVRAMVWARLPPRFGPSLDRDLAWLVNAFSTRSFGWTYTLVPNSRAQDNSIRQFAGLALWEGVKRDGAVPENLWKMLARAFLDGQLDDGGWNYRADDAPGTGSMTAGGLATLYIVQDVLGQGERGGGSRRRKPSDIEAALERGLAWMEANFTPDDNPGRFQDFYYYLYGVERAGLASGRGRFGDHDWFRSGAASILERLCTWDPETGTMAMREDRPAKGTFGTRQLAFALLFLARGRVPIAVNKLELPDGASTHRPRDVANLARRLSDLTEGELNWRLVRTDESVDTWLDAPLLALAAEDLPEDVAFHNRLRTYLDYGGLLLALAESSAFARDVEALGSELYPRLTWRNLPDDHAAYTLHRPVPDRARPRLRALSNGVRELIVLAPTGDVPGLLQAGPPPPAPNDADAAPRSDRRRGPRMSARDRGTWDVLTNLYFYASEMNRPAPRLRPSAVRARGDFIQAKRSIPIVRAIYDGGWNPERGAIEALRAVLAEHADADLAVNVIPLVDLAGAEPRPALVWLVGTAAHAFSPAELDALDAYTSSGGVVLFETAGGVGDFALAAELSCIERFGGTVRPLTAHPIVTGDGLTGGADLRRVTLRPFAQQLLETRDPTPRLRGLARDGAVRFVFSREDLSHGLLDHPVWGVSGHDAASAAGLLTNLVLFAEAPSATPDE